jgi:hypothetical protein
MARSQKNGTTILLGLKGYQVGEVREDDKGIVVEVIIGAGEVICSYCSSARLYRHGSCKPRRVLQSRSNGKKVYLELFHQPSPACNRGGYRGPW